MGFPTFQGFLLDSLLTIPRWIADVKQKNLTLQKNSALDLELPVLTDWSYEKVKKAPCHYYGSYYEKDFVIAAHNYKSHFGRLSALRAGDVVVFTDVNGTAHRYEVALLETLPKTATKEMITSGFDLSLYTCTTGGGSRVTVRCNAV
jgi:sortase A